MSWGGGHTFVDGDKPTAAQLNAHVRDNLRFLHNDDGPTARDVDLWAPGFRANASTLYVQRDYSASPVVYRVLGEKVGGSIANGQKIRILFGLRLTGGVVEPLGVLEATRTAASTGTLAFYPYNGGYQTATPAFLIDPSGPSLYINQATGGAYAVDVAGIVNAAYYRVGGASIGQWTLSGTRMTFDGDAEVTGAFIAGGIVSGTADVQESPVQVESTTLVTDLNAGKLRRYGWPEAKTAATTSPVSVPDDYYNDTELLTLTVDRIGWYKVRAAAWGRVTVAGQTPYLQIFLPGEFDSHGGKSASSNIVGNTINPRTLLRLFVGSAPYSIALSAIMEGQPTMSVSAAMSARWLSPGEIVGAVGETITVTDGTPTVVVT